ncbi:hypothetical protein JCM11491_000939 [Sporobolomyces phaffii]
MATQGGGVISRTSLLALYASPLVPNKLEGMKELSEWYGEYSTPPSPPVQRSQLSSSRTNSSSAVPQSSSGSNNSNSNHRRLTPFNSDSNPFANFGRFGVDGGLIGEPLEMPRRRGGAKQMANGAAGAEEAGKDLAPHLQMAAGGPRKGAKDDSGGTALPPWASEASKREQFLKEERHNRSIRNPPGGASNGELEPRRRAAGGGLNGDATAKDKRNLGPADEGGWRSVGSTREEREKRLLRNQSSNNSNAADSPRRFDRDRRDNHAGQHEHQRGERGDRETYSRGGRGGPAWMNDEDSASAPPWNDSPAGATLRTSKDGGAPGGGAGEREDDEILDVATPTKKAADWQAASGAGGMDSIQQWKQQMKEMERKERERDLRDAGIEPQPRSDADSPHELGSVFTALTSPKPEPASTKSIFEDLGIVRSPAVTPVAPPGLNVGGTASQGGSGEGGAPGGRASRFAKFFDGKPQSPVTQAQQPPPSVFGALMSGASSSTPTAAGTGPSKEDAESMARLMGMLQFQGNRTGSPSTSQPSSAAPTPSGLSSPAAVLPSHSSATVPASTVEETRSSSRFKFSNSAARTSSPSVVARSVPTSQPPSAVHSPTSPNQTIPNSSAGFGGHGAAVQSHHSVSMNQLPPPAPMAAERMRSPPLPTPPSQQQQQMNVHHPRTMSSTSDLGTRPSPHHAGSQPPSASPLPLPSHAMNHPQQHHLTSVGPHAPPSFPAQFYQQSPGQRIPPPPPVGMYPPGATSGPMPPPPPPGMMNAEMLRTLAGVNANGMRSPPLPGHAHQQGPFPGSSLPPPHGLAGMMPPLMNGRGAQGQQQMMFAGPHPSQYQSNGGRPAMPGAGPAMSMGGNAGADLMALLNSGGNGGMRIGNQGPPSLGGHPHQQQGIPPYMMEGR